MLSFGQFAITDTPEERHRIGFSCSKEQIKLKYFI